MRKKEKCQSATPPLVAGSMPREHGIWSSSHCLAGAACHPGLWALAHKMGLRCFLLAVIWHALSAGHRGHPTNPRVPSTCHRAIIIMVGSTPSGFSVCVLFISVLAGLDTTLRSLRLTLWLVPLQLPRAFQTW